MVYHYTLLCTIIHYYCTIIYYYHNYCNYCNYLTIMIAWGIDYQRLMWAWAFLSKTNIRDGKHTEGIMLAKNPSGLITSFGHWHGLVVPGICTRCSSGPAVSAMTVDGMPWIKFVPTVDAFEAQCYWQPFRTVGVPSSRTSTHAVNRFQLPAIFRQWPNRCQLLRNWN